MASSRNKVTERSLRARAERLSPLIRGALALAVKLRAPRFRQSNLLALAQQVRSGATTVPALRCEDLGRAITEAGDLHLAPRDAPASHLDQPTPAPLLRRNNARWVPHGLHRTWIGRW